ncbi:Phage recombination-related endonuclease Gp46 [Yersinia phage fHe-Yen9-04]|uniref:Phage recombination-related endonuclease Gp46 n=1 Tax=Yersinia phage fHe-Yen9-04 TaxID=2052742 RepID=A0A2C9CXM4_9CAUD|nr:Phage recombination-related endonuclease Gp46 [Yersinia phage fHe-Yen9-04]SOK58516.1 Phage recombination-related endonuclease Gp46 [Yersinia phage fHe-Yen9-04]VUE36285.1 Phage recombination-related endonuclease Gp46 [Yersinia phage fHe-Yen9-04]
MLSIKRISMRNFFSFGNAPQVVDLDSTDISLILGQNNDAAPGDDNSGRRNGVGKSAINQAIVFGLYGKSIGNDIKIPNLVNKINSKNCEVIIDFEKDGVEYRIERGRSPTFFNFYRLDENNNVSDESRGEKKDTQEDLTEILGISQLLLEHIVILNASVEPFLSLSQQKQREIIEELLGITQLTEKANLLKDMYKETKRLADQEKFKIETITESNKRIEQSIETLQLRANEFESKKIKTIQELNEHLEDFKDVDFDHLLKIAEEMASAIAHNNSRSNLETRVTQLVAKHEEYSNSLQSKKNTLINSINELSTFNISSELKLHEDLESWNSLNQLLKETLNTKRFKEQQLKSISDKIMLQERSLIAEQQKLDDIANSKCPLCKNSLQHDENHENMKHKSENEVEKLLSTIEILKNEQQSTQLEISSLEIYEMPTKPVTYYSSVSEAKLHEHKLEELTKKSTEEDINIYDEELLTVYSELESTEIKDVIEWYSIDEVKELQHSYNSYISSLERESNSQNPYFDQIETLKHNSLQSVDYDEYNKLTKLADHQDYLTKLLMNKDSFVRRRIIEQNISFLNSRLQYWIDKSGSQHTVEFLNDLSVDINLNGQSYDFKQLSRGERTRVILSLNLAFRDTYESLYQNINIMFVDELLDNGLDSGGIESAWHMLQDLSAVRGKNIFVVSHREELVNRANSILRVVKEDSFSTVEYCDVLDL